MIKDLMLKEVLGHIPYVVSHGQTIFLLYLDVSHLNIKGKGLAMRDYTVHGKILELEKLVNLANRRAFVNFYQPIS